MRKYLVPVLCLGLAGALSACVAPPMQQAKVAPAVTAIPVVTPAVAAPAAPASEIADAAPSPSFTGTASWYRTGRHLHRTYSGALLNNNAYTAASTTLPMGTRVRVDTLDGRSVVVLVNDRMPPNHRLIDLSEIAAKELGLMGCGVATVTVTPIMVASAP